MVEINTGDMSSQYNVFNSRTELEGNKEKDDYKTFQERFAMQTNRAYPYQRLADDNGYITYNGVTYVGDPNSHTLSLGDVSDKNRRLQIQLSSGQYLLVGFDSIEDLSKSIGMFSGADQGIILKALAKFHYEQDVLKQAEDEEENGIQRVAQKAAENSVNEEALTAMEKLKMFSSNLAEKLLHGETEQKIQIGGGEAMTNKEWDKFLEKFDDAEDVIKEAVKQDVEEQKKKKEREDAKSEYLQSEAVKESQINSVQALSSATKSEMI